MSIFVFNLLVIRCGRERKKKEEMTDIIICIIPLPPSEKTSQRIVHPMHTFSWGNTGARTWESDKSQDFIPSSLLPIFYLILIKDNSKAFKYLAGLSVPDNKKIPHPSSKEISCQIISIWRLAEHRILYCWPNHKFIKEITGLTLISLTIITVTRCSKWNSNWI